MSREGDVVKSLVEMADTLVNDYDVVDLLTGLADRCVSLLGVSAAGVMLASPRGTLGLVASSSEAMRLLELFELQSQEGPCLDAHQQGKVVTEPDLADPATRRWPSFTPPAVQAGVRAVFGFPLRVGRAHLGALNLYRDLPGSLTGDQYADALVVADVAARWVLEAQAGASPGTVAEELEAGSEFHFAVHNAAGIVSVQESISVTDALLRLRAFAFSSVRPLADVAQDVIARRLRLG